MSEPGRSTVSAAGRRKDAAVIRLLRWMGEVTRTNRDYLRGTALLDEAAAAIEANAAASPAGPEAAGIRNRLLASRFDPSVSRDELIGAGPEAVPQSEREGLDEALSEIVAAYTDGDWQSFGRLIERAAYALNGRAALAPPAHPDKEPRRTCSCNPLLRRR